MSSQKKLLVVGCHRSGTTLLSAMLSCHSDIALVNEDYYDSHTRILTKKYIGTKMVIPSILLNKKKSKIYVSLLRKFAVVRRTLFGYKHAVSICSYSINDFLDQGKVVFISRNFEDNVNSIVKRTNFKQKYAERDVKRSRDIASKLENHDVFFVKLEELTSDSETVLKSICNYLNIEFEPKMLEGYKYTPTYNNSKIEKKK